MNVLSIDYYMSTLCSGDVMVSRVMACTVLLMMHQKMENGELSFVQLVQIFHFYFPPDPMGKIN